jgi:hypothetical protein
MMIARTSFFADYDDQRVEVIANKTLCDPAHELVRRFPQCFEDELSRGNGHVRADATDSVQRHTRSAPLPLQDELRLRAERLNELVVREQERAARPDATEAFWASVQRRLEDPRQTAQDKADLAMMDAMDAAHAQAARDEIGAVSAWLHD